ncbi:uncharacterized protein BYT42DRAFT_585514 [Radiomyces spectabilis]|uniref:uncharacterized protein n=1 Tax=Radiomyces spectabilis TaxID=64574 RepID=UPI002220B716|nr:uncharacterized protein BYT42DRAFT_585514 [Radiomyces spectabilis]KAI8368161.1 hypothetical protein BYT42DRAFT_585514 [Radiomyces spectabilis]
MLGQYLHGWRRLPSIGVAFYKPTARTYSTARNKVACYVSTINDAYTNLAIEEWLLRDTEPNQYILYLWRNTPCVVVGRNQNPFKECNLRFMQQHGIPLVRRRSGGGAVYHDMGNSIYTIYMPREEFSRKANAELVSRALQQLDIPAYVNERHDITVDGHKVSGSAYKIISARAYHHGTMLIDTDTQMLKGCLSKKYMNNDGIVSKGVESVPSPVTNLREYSYTIDHQQFCESVLSEFVDAYNDGLPIEPVVFNETNVHQLPEKVENTRKELQTWDWIWGQTPEFTHNVDHQFSWGAVRASIRSRHGMILEADLSTGSGDADQVTIISAIGVALEGCRYSQNAVMDAIEKIKIEIPGLINSGNQSIVNDVKEWLHSRL